MVCKQSFVIARGRRSSRATFHCTRNTINLLSYPAFVKLAGISRETRDIPLRAKSVCLAERPHSKHVRVVRSADAKHASFTDKLYFHSRPLSAADIKRRKNCIAKVYVKKQNRKIVEKVPFAVSVKTLSIPMKYADEPKLRKFSPKPPQNQKENEIHVNKTNQCNPLKQVSDNKRLCHTIGCGKETQNKLLVQICEAEQASDFERILKSNAILCQRVRGHVWRGCVAPQKRSASVLPRPRSAYSLYAVSQAYHYLFRQHEESLEPLIEQYRETNAEEKQAHPSILEKSWYENLQKLSEFYEDDQVLKREIDTVTDSIIAHEVKSTEKLTSNQRNKNFNVNLSDLIGLHLTGESCSASREDYYEPSSNRDNVDVENKEEWLVPIMNANSADHQPQSDDNVDCLAQNLESVKIDGDAKLPTITISNCCDGYARSDLPNNNEVVIHLAVPAIDSVDETRPPM